MTGPRGQLSTAQTTLPAQLVSPSPCDAAPAPGLGSASRTPGESIPTSSLSSLLQISPPPLLSVSGPTPRPLLR